MDCGTDIRGINEYSGSFEYRSDETDKFVGQYRMGTAVSVDCLYYSLAHQGQKQCDGIDGCMDQLGPARAAQLIVVSQIAAAYLIELFGLFGVDKANFQWSKVLGLGLSIIGIMIVKWK